MNTRKNDEPHPDIPGQPVTGRITRLLQGGGQGTIRADDGRRAFFHRNETGGTFAEMDIGDVVTFEFVEDRISGARGIRVRKTTRERVVSASRG